MLLLHRLMFFAKNLCNTIKGIILQRVFFPPASALRLQTEAQAMKWMMNKSSSDCAAQGPGGLHPRLAHPGNKLHGSCSRSILKILLTASHFIPPPQKVYTINAQPHLEADGPSNHISAQYLAGSNLIKATQCKSQMELSQSDGSTAEVKGVTGQTASLQLPS